MNVHSTTLSLPRLEAHSQLAFRIGLTRKRTAAYPLDSMDFIMVDLERPDLCTHHSFWCTGDLSGRVLEFLSCAALVEGVVDARLETLFNRIIRQQRASGAIGRYAPEYSPMPPEGNCFSTTCRLFSGLLRYYEFSGDQRAVDAAIGMGEFTLKRKDDLLRHVDRFGLGSWGSEGFALLYGVTGDSRYLEFCEALAETPKVDQLTEPTHSHGFMSTLRGFQLASLISGKMKLEETAEHWRRVIIEKKWEMPDGNIAENFPRSFRNEGCSIADWLMLNLNAGLLGREGAYAKAENILWNALFHNQIMNGAFGHRELSSVGCGYINEADAWWCCTMHAGMAMTEAAKHAVIMKDGGIQINLLLAGDYLLSTATAGRVKVSIRTAYPATAGATITVEFQGADVPVKLRIPSCIENSRLTERRDGRLMRIELKGELRHRIEETEGGMAMVKFGPLVLTPNLYFWREGGRDFGGVLKCHQVPTNYLPPLMPAGVPILLEARAHEGIAPSFSFFEEGPDARCYVPGAPADLRLQFDHGEEKIVYARPLCSTLSSFSPHDSPILFGTQRR